mmetsp:Transcript_2411/g.5370  ORF Transcript_2411/g.5370 Transcript_2411/m.5370 type:complete len:101 (-) Transcript_2411:87-389(-)
MPGRRRKITTHSFIPSFLVGFYGGLRFEHQERPARARSPLLLPPFSTKIPNGKDHTPTKTPQRKNRNDPEHETTVVGVRTTTGTMASNDDSATINNVKYQ